MTDSQAERTIVGDIRPEVLAFTVGKDRELDVHLLDADCIGTAAHVTMLSACPPQGPIFSQDEARAVTARLLAIMRSGRDGQFCIEPADQDVHLAVERLLTEALGDVGRKVHTARSRNDQVALDLRLHARDRLLGIMTDAAALANALLALASRHETVPMVGRTHQQPAMPGSVGLWASAYAESLEEDLDLLRAVYDLNNRNPLGAAAGYGVPLDIDREQTTRLLGFREPIRNVLHACNARGKCEAAVLGALGQVMLTLSRLARDIILYAMPEFAYFELPADCCTGSSIMPQKKNPDVLELIRARTARVLAAQSAAAGIVAGMPGGYNRDLQEIKEPFLEGLQTTAASLRIMTLVIEGLRVNADALRAGFTPEVFAADRALELVQEGRPFREAYDAVRSSLSELESVDPDAAVQRKRHLGAPAGLAMDLQKERVRQRLTFAQEEMTRYYATISKLLGVQYPGLNQAAPA